ncbi:MAG TPA: type II toxin-antitoxin system Phd/YefM family antitoxin, partial [Dissulfurispiraceae bacterium]
RTRYDIVAINVATWRCLMKFANVRELKNKTSEILRNAEKEAVIITSKGKPRAIVTALSEEDFEDYLLEKSIGLQDMLAEAMAEYKSKGGVLLEDYLSKRKKRRG